MFLSFGFLAVLLHPHNVPVSYRDWPSPPVALAFAGLLTLAAMLALGAFQTGETARAALFIYPYIMLLLGGACLRVTENLLRWAAVQTVAMQLFGGYFW
jgi:hypothetical protein